MDIDGIFARKKAFVILVLNLDFNQKFLQHFLFNVTSQEPVGSFTRTRLKVNLICFFHAFFQNVATKAFSCVDDQHLLKNDKT